MQDAILIRFNEFILLLYIMSLSCYFIDFLSKHYMTKRLGYYLMGIVWVAQTISLLLGIVKTQHVPLGSIFEVFNVLSWLIILISLVVYVYKKLEITLFFFNCIGVILMAIYTFQPVEFQHNGAKFTAMNELLVAHISLAVMSYAFFAFSFVNALVYLLQYRNLKKKRFNKQFVRITSIDVLGRVVFYTALIGFISLLVSLILGLQWGIYSIGLAILSDPKVISSLVIVILYGVFVVLLAKKQHIQAQLMYLNIGLFVLTMANMFIITHLSTFHKWTGI